MHHVGFGDGAVITGSHDAQQPPGPTPVSDQADIASEESHPIEFLLLGPGAITVHSVPSPKPGHSETGTLGWATILRPGGGTPAAHVVAKLTDAFLGATYTATAADAALQGHWTAVIHNGSLDAATWATVVGGNVAPVPPTPTATVSFDIELFNLIVAEVMNVAGIAVHLQSDGGSETLSTVSWSPALANRLGKASIAFHVPDPSSSVGIPGTGDSLPVSFRIHGLDSASTSLILGGDPPTLLITIGFEPTQLEGLNGTPDLDIHSLTLHLDVVFDGGIAATCEAAASTLDGLKDESDTLASAMAAQVDAQVHATEGDFAKYTDPTAVQMNLEAFFGRLMHIPVGAKIRAFRSDGSSLFVDYVPPAPLPAHAVHEVVGGL